MRAVHEHEKPRVLEEIRLESKYKTSYAVKAEHSCNTDLPSILYKLFGYSKDPKTKVGKKVN